MKNVQNQIREAINQQVMEIKQLAQGYQGSTHTTAKEYDELARTLISKAQVMKDLAYKLTHSDEEAVRS